MSYVKTVSEENASGVIRRVYDAANARESEVAEIIQVMSMDPKSAQASMNMYTNLMKVKNGLLPVQREMLATVVSAANSCHYCAQSHARDFGRESEVENKKLAQQISLDYRESAISDQDKVLCDYAVKLTLTPDEIGQEDLEILRDNGFKDDMIVTAVQVIGYFNYINRVANALGVDPEIWMMEERDDWMKKKAKFKK